MADARLLKTRADIKRRKPTFINEETKKIKKLSRRGWRKPRGWHNKMRHGFKGHRRCVRAGWGSPTEVKGLHRSGLQIVIVSTAAEVERLNPATQGMLIGGTVGTKRRMELIGLAIKKNITILNIKEPAKFLEGKTADLKKRKEDSLARKEAKKKKSKEAPKKSIEQKVDKELTDDEKKDKEKKELDKALITEKI